MNIHTCTATLSMHIFMGLAFGCCVLFFLVLRFFGFVVQGLDAGFHHIAKT